jgi:hypothetical protein
MNFVRQDAKISENNVNLAAQQHPHHRPYLRQHLTRDQTMKNDRFWILGVDRLDPALPLQDLFLIALKFCTAEA